jgi:hypothetical protein
VPNLFRSPDEADGLLHGDLWDRLPFLLARRLPLSVMRKWPEMGPKGTPLYAEYVAGATRQPQRSPIRLDYQHGGDDVLAVGFQSLGIVLSHDCEIENAPDHILVAPVLPWSNLHPDHQDEALKGDRYDVLPLVEGDDPAEWHYVKYARLCVVHNDVFEKCKRTASASTALRRILALGLHRYLTHPEDRTGGSGS